MMECPNVMLIPSQDETAEDIIDDYEAMIKYNLDRGVPIRELLSDFFSDVNRWSCKQFLIDQAKECLQELENIHQLDMENVVDEDELDDDDYEHEY
jgi:hypothetical protein